MTRSRFKAPKGFLDVAGTRLGLNLVDLFNPSEKDQSGLEGFAPVFNMQTQYTTKGRGGVLSYKTPKLPTTTYTNEFSLIPDSNTKKSYTWPGTEGNKGGTGYGMLDLEDAIKAGYTEQEVGDYLKGNKGLFGPGKLNVGPLVREKFGLDSSYENYTWSSNLGGTGYGGKDLEEALKLSSPEAVGNYLKTNKNIFGPGKLNVGPAVREKFGLDNSYVNPLVNSPTTTAKKSYNWNEFGNLGGPGFGGEDLAAAKNAQFSDDEIKDYIVKNKQLFGSDRLNVGPAVRSQLGLDSSYEQRQQTNQPEDVRFANVPTSATAAAPAPTTAARQAKVLDVNRFYSADLGKHFYSSDPNEQSPGGYTKEGLGFKLFDDSDATEGASDVFRLYHPDQRDHLYTTNKAEADSAQRGGYTLEKTIGEAYTTEREGTTPVFRFASPTGKHFYTSDQNEVKSLGNLGYKSEGTAFYSPFKQVASAAAAAPAPAPTFAAPAPSAAVAKKSYNWNEFGNLGGPGFGGEDLAAAKNAQFSDDEIKDYIVKNKQLFGSDRLNVGPAVRSQFGLDSSYNNPAYS